MPKLEVNKKVMDIVSQYGGAVAKKISLLVPGAVPIGIIAVDSGKEVDLLFQEKNQGFVHRLTNVQLRQFGNPTQIGVRFEKDNMYVASTAEDKEYELVAKANKVYGKIYDK